MVDREFLLIEREKEREIIKKFFLFQMLAALIREAGVTPHRRHLVKVSHLKFIVKNIL